MDWMHIAPWLVLAGYALLILYIAPRRVSSSQFFAGGSRRGVPPGPLLLGVSAAISWVMAKSVANTMNLTSAFGIWGGIGYAAYWLAFIVVGVTVYFMRTRGGYRSLAQFLTAKYGATAAKLFLIVIAIRLYNEVWSNTKVTALFFGPEGSAAYWLAALATTGLTLYYSLRGGLRSSILTDAMQMLLISILLVVILVVLVPDLLETGIPTVANGMVTTAMRAGGLTFLALALVQTLSYGFHDPVLTDLAFVSPAKSMVVGFILAALLGGAVIALFAIVGLYAIAMNTGTEPSVAVAVPAVIGLWMALIFNAVMLTSAGSSLDSTFSSSAKFAARDWPGRGAEPTLKEHRIGRRTMIGIALLGNLPLLSLYITGIGPAIIAATTISGTAIMGLAPIFLLSWLRPAGKLSFHLALWPGVAIGVLLVIEKFLGVPIIPQWVYIGTGSYAQTLGVNVWGLALCTSGYLAGAGVSLALPQPEAA